MAVILNVLFHICLRTPFLSITCWAMISPTPQINPEKSLCEKFRLLIGFHQMLIFKYALLSRKTAILSILEEQLILHIDNVHAITLQSSVLLLNSVFDKLIWCTVGPKSFLFGTPQFSLWAGGSVNDHIVAKSINSLLIGSRYIPNGTLNNHAWANLAHGSKSIKNSVANTFRYYYYIMICNSTWIIILIYVVPIRFHSCMMSIHNLCYSTTLN